MQGNRSKLGTTLGALALLLSSAAAPGAGALDASVEVTNVAPVVVSVSLPASVSPVAGGDASVAVAIVVQDLNGYNDIASVTIEVLKPDGTTTHVAASAANPVSGSGINATYGASFGMRYYDDPATGDSTYKVRVVATDEATAFGTNVGDLATFAYTELTAMNIVSSAVDFGSELSPGTQSLVDDLTLQNYGNTRLDVALAGTDLVHGTEDAAIPVGNVDYSLGGDMASRSALSGGTDTVGSFDLAHGPASTKSLYFQLDVPSGAAQWIPAGDYVGSLSVAALKG